MMRKRHTKAARQLVAGELYASEVAVLFAVPLDVVRALEVDGALRQERAWYLVVRDFALLAAMVRKRSTHPPTTLTKLLGHVERAHALALLKGGR